MKKLFKSALLATLFLIASAGGAFGQAPARIEGVLTDARGHSTAWLFITARHSETGRSYEAKTDRDGSFVFENLEPGRYILWAEYPGVERVIQVVTVRPGETARTELYAYHIRTEGTDALHKFFASTSAQGGSYPGGNISYLNVNDALDLYFIWAYFGILGLLSFYGIYRYRMIYLFLRYRKHRSQPKARFAPDRLPRVTVQVPLFNERYVAERLIESVVGLDYPRELLEIQVLDDSTDETKEIASRAVKKYYDEGFDITYHHRDDRRGFKAGALEEGLKKSSGELIMIFDADFTPRPDCLRRLVDYFTDERVGMVQMRWSHINADYSLLTKVQAIMLDGHFIIEQTARNRSGGFFNFNGTAGMWWRETIEWSGNWQHDTLAEDTDLSYRAQLMGWHFIYLVDDDVPAELPVEIHAFKSQQRR
ncbi:MAG TPA: glycosyltransferase, partial [Blastocatellia bacterium]|nr:glycosyltransferase [Blastocatellia bacterium]